MAADKITVKFLKLNENAIKPEYKTVGSSGMDVRSTIDCELNPGERKLIPTGWAAEIPEGYEIQVRSRSGLAINYGVIVLNEPGTVDSDYRGEIKVILYNSGSEVFPISVGDRIAQLVLAKCEHADVVVVDTIQSSTERGDGGFGHTGVK